MSGASPTQLAIDYILDTPEWGSVVSSYATRTVGEGTAALKAHYGPEVAFITNEKGVEWHWVFTGVFREYLRQRPVK